MLRTIRKYQGYWCLLLLGAGPSWAVEGADLPPVGQRTYVIGADGGRAPVAILRDGGGHVLREPMATPVMRDPALAGSGPKRPQPQQKKAVVRRSPVVGMREKAASLRFGRVKIVGKASRPSVDFVQQPLPFERVDEPLSRDFFQKVFLPGRDESL